MLLAGNPEWKDAAPSGRQPREGRILLRPNHQQLDLHLPEGIRQPQEGALRPAHPPELVKIEDSDRHRPVCPNGRAASAPHSSPPHLG